MPTVPANELTHYCERILEAAGVPRNKAQITAACLVASNLRGVDSHGIQLLLLFPNPTGMPYAVAATAWGHVLGCKTFNRRIFDAFRDFRLAYTNQGPEHVQVTPSRFVVLQDDGPSNWMVTAPNQVSPYLIRIRSTRRARCSHSGRPTG